MSALPSDHLSFSQLNQFAGNFGCEMAYYFDRVEKRPRQPAGAGLFCGKVWDDTTGTTHLEQLTPVPPTPETAAERFVDNATRIYTGGVGYDGEPCEYDVPAKSMGEIKDQGAAAAAAFVREKVPTIHPVSVQHKVTVAFDEVDWTLIGYIDLVEAADTGVIVTDHKSTMGATKYDAEKAAIDLQLNLYDLALSLEGSVVVGRGFRLARILKTKHELSEAFAPSLPEHHATTLDLLGNIAARIETACETGVFLPTARLAGSYKCSLKYCDFFESVCPYGARARVQVAVGGTVAA